MAGISIWRWEAHFSPDSIWALDDCWITATPDYLIIHTKARVLEQLTLTIPTEHCETEVWKHPLGREEEEFSFSVVEGSTSFIGVV